MGSDSSSVLIMHTDVDRLATRSRMIGTSIKHTGAQRAEHTKRIVNAEHTDGASLVSTWTYRTD